MINQNVLSLLNGRAFLFVYLQMAEKIFPYQQLVSFTRGIFEKIGCSPSHAQTATDALLSADLRGIDSHGVARLSGYVRLWEVKRVNTNPTIRIIHESPSTAVLDGYSGLGLVVAPFAMNIAMGMSSGIEIVGGAGKAVTVKYGDEAVSVYRGGSDFTIKPGEIKIDKATGMVKDTHGVSLNVNPYTVSNYCGAYKIDSLPDGLKIIQQGKNAEHYVIVPSRPMNVDEFQGFFNQVKTLPVSK